MFRWPEARTVDRAVRRWVREEVQKRPHVLQVGYIGSYARGDWGVGSDLDVIIVMERCEQPFWQRTLEWDLTSLPVPADVLVYTREGWQALARQGRRFYRTVEHEAIWVYVSEAE